MVVREHRKRKNRHQTAAPARFQTGSEVRQIRPGCRGGGGEGQGLEQRAHLRRAGQPVDRGVDLAGPGRRGAFNCAARGRRPSASRKAPCGTGPWAAAPAWVAAAASASKSTWAVKSASRAFPARRRRHAGRIAWKLSPGALCAGP